MYSDTKIRVRKVLILEHILSVGTKNALRMPSPCGGPQGEGFSITASCLKNLSFEEKRLNTLI